MFGSNTTLADKIYSCQLLDEKDGIYKSFGIDRLLKGIYEFFKKKEKENLKKIRDILKNQNNNYNNLVAPNFFTNLNNQNNNYNQPESKFLTNDQIFFTSLTKNNYNFEEYLNILCDDIIKYYSNKINEYANKNNDSGYKNNMIIKGIKMLIKHLSYELNRNLSDKEIDDIISKNFYKEKNKNERIKEVGNNAKNILLKKLCQTKDDEIIIQIAINNYFDNLVESYIKAINSLEILYKK